MTKENNDIDLSEIEEEINQIDEENKTQENEKNDHYKKQLQELEDKLARNQADYQNLLKRTERDRIDNIFYSKQKILSTILPIIDDLERIIEQTSEHEKETIIYKWNILLKQKIDKIFSELWLKSFSSIWEEVDINKHEVMTKIPSDNPWLIVDEFEKWYILWDKIIRVAKVVVWDNN